MSSGRVTQVGLAVEPARLHHGPMWNETQAQPKDVPWRLFAIEAFIVLLIVGTGCLVSALS